jgi:methanogenic corrinoid protein MtbC1
MEVGNLSKFIEELREAIINGDREEAEAITKKALESNIDPQVLIQEAGSKAMDIVGQRFNDFEIFLPDLTLAADAMKGSVGLIIEKLKETGGGGEDSVANVVLGTCFGDMHDIGKNLVSVLMATAGMQVHDIGVDVKVKDFIQKAEEVDAKIIAMSSLLSTSLPFMEDLIRILKEKNLRDKYYVIVGGGPVTPEFAVEIGADAYGRSAVDAREICKQLLSSGKKPPFEKPVILGDLKTN